MAGSKLVAVSAKLATKKLPIQKNTNNIPIGYKHSYRRNFLQFSFVRGTVWVIGCKGALF